MDADSPDGFTFLQRRILHQSAAHPGLSYVELADRVDCSASYVRDVVQNRGELIAELEWFQDVEYGVSFAHPYSILLPEGMFEECLLEEGDVLELSFTVGDREESTYGRVVPIEEEMVSPGGTERHARVQGAYHAGRALKQSTHAAFEELPTLDDGRANLASADEFISFIQTVEDIFENCIDGVQMMVGVGIIEVLHGERNPSNLISTPYFELEADYFRDYFLGDRPELTHTELYRKEVHEPEEVYFTCYTEQLTPDEAQQAREEILDYGVFKSSWYYKIPQYAALVGPTTTDPTPEVIRVTDDALQIVPGIKQPVIFGAEDGNVPHLDVDTVHTAIQEANPQFSDLATHSRHSAETEGLPIRKTGDQLLFLFDQVTLVLEANGNRITWEAPEGIKRVETIKKAVTDMIKQKLGCDTYEFQNPEYPRYQRQQHQDWVFDTNALYHDHVDNQPTSILHTLYTHDFFYGSTIHIPYAVIHELNKHPESGSATEATNDQGFENLSMLRTLEQFDFLSVHFQPLPERIHANLDNNDIADLHILAYTEHTEAQLVTGDGSLQELAQLTDISAVDIRHFNGLSSPIRDGSSPESDILPQIGVNLHTRADILAAISDMINPNATLPVTNSGRQSTRTPESILNTWVSSESILPYYDSDADDLSYRHLEDVVVIPTQSALRLIPDYISENHLDVSLLSQLSAEMNEVDNTEFPYCTFRIPTEYIIDNASNSNRPSEFNQDLLALCEAPNANYESMPVLSSGLTPETLGSTTNSDEDDSGAGAAFLSREDYLALCLAVTSESAYLLLPETQSGLWKFSKLLGVNVVTIEQSKSE
ncbi:PIN domain-containing protein [Halorubellus sp. PRR65]|uniref:PIN domain-containing protein n=1 Tax=Halorubellus sp. PRR65 TaxID=3098148 RepID=UPI002B25F383|nr:PIN domain-containing protein [Halorubellus sp. PRR65]